MNTEDLLLIPLYGTLILIISYIIRELFYRKYTYKRYFLSGLIVKLIGALLFAAVYQFYYQGGDTIEYHRAGNIMYRAFVADHEVGWELLTLPVGEITIRNVRYAEQIGPFFYSANSVFVSRLDAFLGLFCFGNFWVISMFFAVISFSGLWALFRVFISIFPHLLREAAIAVFFLPSVFFWGSGIMKDTLSIACLGWLVYCIYHLFTRQNRILLSLLVIPITVKTLLVLKAYIVAGMVPAISYWLIGHYYSLLRGEALRRFIRWTVCFVILTIAYLNRSMLLDSFNNGLIRFAQMAIAYQGWHSFLGEVIGGTSAYSLGEIDFTPWGIIKKFPASVVATFFRPYIYEVNTPIALFTACESTFMLLLTLYTLAKKGILNILSNIFRHPFIGFCVIFALLFGFAVGFSTFNFGALARYKIPCLPFYVFALYAILTPPPPLPQTTYLLDKPAAST